MRTLQVTIPPEYTGLHNYEEQYGCPLAMSLRLMGYYDVYVGYFTWRVRRPFTIFGWHLFSWPVAGFISQEVNTKLAEISRTEQSTPVKVILFRGSGKVYDHPIYKHK